MMHGRVGGFLSGWLCVMSDTGWSFGGPLMNTIGMF